MSRRLPDKDQYDVYEDFINTNSEHLVESSISFGDPSTPAAREDGHPGIIRLQPIYHEPETTGYAYMDLGTLPVSRLSDFTKFGMTFRMESLAGFGDNGVTVGFSNPVSANAFEIEVRFGLPPTDFFRYTIHADGVYHVEDGALPVPLDTAWHTVQLDVHHDRLLIDVWFDGTFIRSIKSSNLPWTKAMRPMLYMDQYAPMGTPPVVYVDEFAYSSVDTKRFAEYSNAKSLILNSGATRKDN